MKPFSTRRYLAQITYDVHQALHHDPVLSQLLDPMISPERYTRALSVFAHFYQVVEELRVAQGVYLPFSLEADCAALDRDLIELRVKALATNKSPLQFESDAAMLGGLYVAHGASFGRNAMRKSLQTALPELSHHFFQRRLQGDTWNALLQAVEVVGERRRKELAEGAEHAFKYVKMLCVAQNTVEAPLVPFNSARPP